MNRPKALFSLVGLLALLWLGLWISSWWGTITLDFEKKPLATVLRSFTQQSGLKVITDLDLTKPMSIHIRRVPVSEALDALQASAESRGRLAILLAPDAPSMKNLLSALPTPTENSGILSIEYRTPWLFRGGIDNLPIDRDPRQQNWKISTIPPLQLVPSLESAAQATEIRLLLPEKWNPSLKHSAKSGPVQSSIPALAKDAGGVCQIAYILPARSERDGPGGPPATSDSNRGSLNWKEPTSLTPDALLTRLESRSAGLPPSEQADALKSAQESVRQYREWSTLTEEERDKKRQEIMNDPARAERSGEGFSRAMRKMSPEQRSQRYNRYVQRRATQKGG